MKQETKKLIEKGVIWFAPIFTLIMFALPWMCYYKEKTTYTDTYSHLYSFFNLLTKDINLFTSIIMWVSLLGVATSVILYILGVVLKDKEKLFTKIGAIALVVSTGILFLTTFAQISGTTILTGVTKYVWVDFMTLPYGIAIVYNVASLIYLLKKVEAK